MAAAAWVVTGDGGKIASSTDALAWTLRTSGFGTSYISGVTYAAALDRYVAVGGPGKIATSPDGTTWTQRTSGTSETLLTVAWAASLGLFIVAGTNGVLLTSPDGITWTARTSGFGALTIMFVAWSPALSMLVAGGSNGTLSSSPDGINWTSRTSGITGGNITAGVWSPGLSIFAIVSSNGRIATSSNGTSWTVQSTLSFTNYYSITWSPSLGKFLAGRNGGNVTPSSDGITWGTPVYTGASVLIYGVYWSEANSLFVAVGESGHLVTSSTGLASSWTVRTSGFGSSDVASVVWPEAIVNPPLAPAGMPSLEAFGSPSLSVTPRLISPAPVLSPAINLLGDAQAAWLADFYDGSSHFLKDLTGHGHHMRLGTTFPAYIARGALNLSGVAGHYASTPDSVTNSITGDIDVVVHAALADWTPSATQTLMSHDGAGNDRGWNFLVATTGVLRITTYPGGLNANTVNSDSTVAPTVVDGADLWVRFTRSASTGTVTFYTSPDGSAWTQLGATVATAPNPIFDPVAPLVVGSISTAFSPLNGRIFYAELRNGIAGPVVATFDPSAQPDFSTSWISSTGETWAVNRPGARIDSYGGGVILDGLSGSYLTTPGFASLDVVGDLDIIAKLSMDDWSPAVAHTIVAKNHETSNNRGYLLRVLSSGALNLRVSQDGTTYGIDANSTANLSAIANGAVLWVRATRDSTSGVVTFYTSTDGTTWVQFGATVAAATGAGFVAVSQLEIGSHTAGNGLLAGAIHRIIIKSGIAGTAVFDADFTKVEPYSLWFIASTGQKVFLNGQMALSSSAPIFLDYTGTSYVYLPPGSGNFLSVPDAAALDVTGDIDLRSYVALDDWTPASANTLIAKRNSSIAYHFYVEVGGALALVTTNNGTTQRSAASTVNPAVADGTALWVRVTRSAATGTVTFYTSLDGVTWTQLGSTVATTAEGIFASSDNVEIGSRVGGAASLLAGKVYRAQIYDGIGGTKVLDVDTSVARNSSSTFLALTGQVVSLIRAASSGRRLVVVERKTFLFGTDRYMECPDPLDGSLDFGTTDNYTLLAAFRIWATGIAGQQRILSKTSALGVGSIGYGLHHESPNLWTTMGDGTNYIFAGRAPTVGALHVLVGTRDVAADRLGATIDGGTRGLTVDSTTGSLANSVPVNIGRAPVSAGGYADMEFFGSSIFRRSLSSAEVTSLSSALSDPQPGMGTPTVANGMYSIDANSPIASAESFGALLLASTIALSPTGILSSQAFGTAAIRSAIALLLSGIASSYASGGQTIVPGQVVIVLVGLPSGEIIPVPYLVAPSRRWPAVVMRGSGLAVPPSPYIRLAKPKQPYIKIRRSQ